MAKINIGRCDCRFFIDYVDGGENGLVSRGSPSRLLSVDDVSYAFFYAYAFVYY